MKVDASPLLEQRSTIHGLENVRGKDPGEAKRLVFHLEDKDRMH